ncbi:MAG: glycosyltransferase family 2 protein [Bacteroidales bacterium]|nr:glycosyltransferase family 2 protein [Bacteroidales bacterium]
MEGTAVIITVFNKEKYLRDTIESVLTQHLDYSTTQPASTTQPFSSIQSPLYSQSTGVSLSIILCDDGSTDKSREICAEYAALYNTSKASVPEGVAETAGEDSAEPNERSVPSVSVYDITDGVHRGVVGNFLHCLEFALFLNVQYISQIDSDDILADPYFIARQTTFLDSHPQAQAACSNFFLIGEKDTLKDARKMFPGSILTGADGVAYYRNLKITPEVLLTKNNTLVAGGVTYRAEYIREYLDSFASKEDATQDLPLWLFLSLKGSFWGSDIQSLAYRNLAESVSRSEDIETQLKFQQESLNTRLRFIKFVGLERLEPKARLLYQKKMLRHYAKLSPKAYPKQLKQAIKSNPSLLLSSDLWRSLGVYLKNR